MGGKFRFHLFNPGQMVLQPRSFGVEKSGGLLVGNAHGNGEPDSLEGPDRKNKPAGAAAGGHEYRADVRDVDGEWLWQEW